jgi:hypothetical protein
MVQRLGYDAGCSQTRNRMTTDGAEIDVQQFHDEMREVSRLSGDVVNYIANDVVIRSI